MMPPLIRLENVDAALDGRIVLHSLDWRLRPGESWAVLGGNGAGKSTFLKLIRGEIAPAPGCGGKRAFAFDGDEQTTAVGVQEKMPLISPEFQERYLRMEWSRTAAEVVESGIGGGDYLYRHATQEEKTRMRDTVQWLGIKPLLRRNIQELSTGELRKVLIARALAGAPRVLVCDELCDGLDAQSRPALLVALNRIARAGTQLIFTTHRAEELIPAITHRLVLRDGRIVEREPISGSGESKRRARRAVPSTPPRNGFLQPKGTGHSLIRIESASVFLGDVATLRNISWEWHAGEHWALTGPNGAGKTTFLKLVCGDVHPAFGGRVHRFEFTPGSTLWELRRKIGFVSPALQASYREPLSGAEVIASGFFSSVGLMQRPSSSQLSHARAVAKRLGFAALAARNTMQMSYGEFRKILLARALVHQPEVLVLDEPFDGLDAESKAKLAETLECIAYRGTSLLVVTHHESDLPSCISHLAQMDQGRIVAQGPRVSAAHRDKIR
jgi:molybdate transport system ATP-binding protein